jgi:acetyl esterase
MVNDEPHYDEPLGALAPEQRKVLSECGPCWGDDINGNRQKVVDFYTPVLAAASKGNVTVQHDVNYGPHARHVMDIFLPGADSPSVGTGRDAVVFVHGGAFVRGKKSVNGEIYDNVCYWFARQGLVAFNVEYRLADDGPYPGGAEDVCDALASVHQRAATLGIDPARVFLIGHSAGGSHAAACLFDPTVAGRAEGLAVAGLVLVSGRLVADVRQGNPNAEPVRAYFGGNNLLYTERSPLSHVARSGVPLMIAVAEYENPYLDEYGAMFFLEALRHRGVPPRFIQMRGHNHTSIVAHFNSGEDYLGREMLHFFASVPR